MTHFAFAVAFAFAVVFSVTVVYPGTTISVAWPSCGIAVWWAVTCRSRRAFVGVCVAVFVLWATCLALLGKPYWTVLLISFSNVIAGPMVAPILSLLEWGYRPWRRGSSGELAPPPGIDAPRHITQLVVAAVLTVSIAKLFTVLSLTLNDANPSATLYLSLVLRDLAGVIVIAGPGIAIFTTNLRNISSAALREFAAAVAVTIVLLALVFWPGQDLPLVYLVMFPLYWSATRMPVVLAALHVVITVIGTILLTYFVGAGPFGVEAGNTVLQASAIQLFMIACVVLSLVVSTTVQRHTALLNEYEAVAATIPDALVLVGRQGSALPLNTAAEELVVQDADGKLVARGLRHVDGLPLEAHEMPDVRALRGEEVRGVLYELDVADAEAGEKTYYAVRASSLVRTGELEPSHALLLYHDSTDEYENVKKLQRAHDEARHLFEHAPQGVAALSEAGEILQANQAFGELVGASPVELEGHRLDEFDEEGDLAQHVQRVVTEPGKLVQVDRTLQTRDGFSRRVAWSFRTLAADVAGEGRVLVNAVDVTERQRLHELVSRLADQDALTGLFNRRRFEAELIGILERSAREDIDGALLLIDLDHFKQVNDLHGHQVGDNVLIELADVLRQSVRSGDVVARIGGDEFIVALPNADRAAAETVGERIVQKVRDRFGGRRGALGRLTASVGAAMFSEAHDQNTDPYVLADHLLYAAKQSGRNRFAASETDTDGASVAEEPFSVKVARILEHEALRIELQPIAEVETGRIVRGEALVRVADGEDPVAPGQLVGEIERAGLGQKLDVWVLSQAIALLPELLRACPEFRLSVNVSGQSFGSSRTALVVLQELDRHGVPPETLILELTETAPVEDFDAARQAQALLRDRGVMLAIDDFGIGADAFRCLKELDFDVLKIAGEFVTGMAEDSLDASIVRSLVLLAREQGMDTVAEVVTDEHVFEAARGAGVSHVQGHHIGASLPPAAFIETHLSRSAGT